MADIKVKAYQKIVNGKLVMVPDSERHLMTLQHLLPPAMHKVIPKLVSKPGSHPVFKSQKSLFGDDGMDEPKKPKGPPHPKPDEDGKPVHISSPTIPTAADTWTNPDTTATFVPGGEAPASLNGIPFTPWKDHPVDPDEWDDVPGQKHDLKEPPMGSQKDPAAGVVVEEPDGRIWIVHPTNAFGGYKATFPKGHVEEGIDLQASAIKEAYEESGLQVEITGYLCDVERTTTTARYYLARRVGGSPVDAGWEAQAVSLVPRKDLYQHLNQSVDHGIAEKLGAGPKPVPPEPKKYNSWW